MIVPMVLWVTSGRRGSDVRWGVFPRLAVRTALLLLVSRQQFSCVSANPYREGKGDDRVEEQDHDSGLQRLSQQFADKVALQETAPPSHLSDSLNSVEAVAPTGVPGTWPFLERGADRDNPRPPVLVSAPELPLTSAPDNSRGLWGLLRNFLPTLSQAAVVFWVCTQTGINSAILVALLRKLTNRFQLLQGWRKFGLSFLLYEIVSYLNPWKHTGALRGDPGVRDSLIFKLISAYYPHRNVFTVPLKSSGDDHYLFGVHPHGVLALSMAPTFAEGTGLETTLLMANEEDLYPGDDQPKKNRHPGSGPQPKKNAPEGLGVPEPMENLPAPVDQPKKTASDEEEKNQVVCCTVDAAFYLPFAGEWAQLAGLTTAVKEKMVTNLEAKKSVGIYVGGADEALLAGGGKMRVLLKDRMGFVEVALRTNTPLVPVLVFGETALYRQVFHPRLREFQHSMMKKLSFSLPAFRGEESYWNPLLPKQTPLHTVFGAPIPMPPCPGGGKWTKETPGFREAVRAVHALYVQRLKELHAQWKHLGTAEDQELEIVSLAEAQSEDMLEQLREGQKRMDELKREGQYELPGPRDILDFEQGTDVRKIKRIFRSKL